MATYSDVKRRKLDEMSPPPGGAGGGKEEEEAEVEEENVDAYTCMSCLLEARPESVYHSVQLMSDSFFNYLLSSINDTTGGQHGLCMGRVVVPVPVDCENCREEMEVKAGISATPVWDCLNGDDEEDNDHDVNNHQGKQNGDKRTENGESSHHPSPTSLRISHFQDIKVVDIMPPDTPLDDSLQTCFYSDNTDAENEWQPEVVADFDFRACVPPGEANKEKTLIVLARSQIDEAAVGSSYVTYDVVERKLLRLVFQVSSVKCSLYSPDSLSQGERYKFAVLRHPSVQKKGPSPTLHPHRNEDAVVGTFHRHLPYPKPVDLYELLKERSHPSIKKIFSPGHIYDKKYIWVNRNCPSVGVLSCRDYNAQFYTDSSDRPRVRIYLDECWDLPVTGSDTNAIKTKDRGREILLLLALNHPWTNNGLYKPARCYISCVASFIRQIK